MIPNKQRTMKAEIFAERYPAKLLPDPEEVGDEGDPPLLVLAG